MPRSPTHVLTMQRTRQKHKEKSLKYLGNANVSLQVSINDIIKNKYLKNFLDSFE